MLEKDTNRLVVLSKGGGGLKRGWGVKKGGGG